MNKKRWFAAILCVCVMLVSAPALAGRYAGVKLIVSRYETEGGAIEAGSEAELRVTVTNTNAYAGARNIVFTLEDSQGRLIPRGPSGVYMESIPRGGEAQASFSLMALPDSLPGYARLTLTAEYEDDEGSATVMRADMYVEIAQPVRLEHTAAVLPARAVEGDNIAFSMDLMNMGKGTVYNALLAFDVPGLNGGSAVLAGNIEPGETKTGRANLLVSGMDGTYGETSGSLTLSWEDAAGRRYEKEMPLATEIVEKVVVPVEETAGKEEESAFPAWLPSCAIALAGVGAIIGVQISIDRRRRRERDEKLL